MSLYTSVHRYFRRGIFVLLLTLSHYAASFAAAPTETDAITFSLLTCAPGERIYTLFGHTAIRYQHAQRGIDEVYNYGLFSFNTPNFIWRFVKGETDYRLGIMDFNDFKAEYEYENRTVWEQVLNLTPEEKKELLKLLRINYLPTNRVYRYSFLYDNCATRPRDKIEECIAGSVRYQTEDYRLSFRHIIHKSAQSHPWERFGMDFCLGPKADRPITYREEMFHPILLKTAFANASIVDNEGKQRPLISHTTEVVVSKDTEKAATLFFTPLRVSLLIFILIVSATIYGIRRKKSLWGIDIALFALAGLAGCVITFLSFFSEHPAVSPNYLIAVFHPLHILALPFFVYKEAKRKESHYHLGNIIVLTLFIMLWPLIPQYFDLAVLPLALCLLVRSVNHLILTYNKKK